MKWIESGTLFLLIWAGVASPLAAQTTVPARPAGDSSLDLVLARLNSIEQRLSRLENQAVAATPATAPLSPENPANRAEDIAARIDTLDQQLRIIDRKRELDQETLASRFTEAPVVEANRDGFSLRSADSSFLVKFGGYFQADGRFFTGPGQLDTSTFVLRRIRPVLTGTLYRRIEFRLMPDFANGTATLQDVHLDFRFFPKASVRFGKFKAPFSLERLQSATDLTFIERAYPTYAAPNRDLGVQVYGDFGSGTFNYALAVLNGVPDGGSADLDTNDGKDYVARVFFQPWIRNANHKAKGLGFGLAVSHGRQDGNVLPVYRTTPQSAFLTYTAGTVAAGDRNRIGPQGYYYAGPFGVFAEYTISDLDVRRGSTADTMRNRAWQTALSYYLTGEKKGYRSPAPSNPFDRGTEGNGAFELAGRYSEMSIDRDAFALGFADATHSARKAQEWTAGINWYLTRGNKFAVNYSHTHFTGGSLTGNRISEKTLLTRFQVAF